MYDTVLFAIGRRTLTQELKPENAGIKLVPETGKIDAVNEQTNVPNIYAVGDVLHVSFLNMLYQEYVCCDNYNLGNIKYLLLF